MQITSVPLTPDPSPARGEGETEAAICEPLTENPMTNRIERRVLFSFVAIVPLLGWAPSRRLPRGTTHSGAPGHRRRSSGPRLGKTAPAVAEILPKDPRIAVHTIADPERLGHGAARPVQRHPAPLHELETSAPGQAARTNLKNAVAKVARGWCWSILPAVPGRIGRNSASWPAGCGTQRSGRTIPAGRSRSTSPRPTIRSPRGWRPSKPTTSSTRAWPARRRSRSWPRPSRRSIARTTPWPSCAVRPGGVFHCVLGHDVKALSVPGVAELFRRGTAWAAGQPPVADK